MKTVIYIIVPIAAILLIAFFLGGNFGEETQPDRVAVPDDASSSDAVQQQPSGDSGIFKLSFKDYAGNAVNLSDFSGKPLVLNSWAAWCPFCRQELPDFVTAQNEFGDKVVIVAIDRQESLATAKGYTDKQGTTGKLIFLLDPGDSFYQSIGGFSMPETIFVNAAGEIVHHKRGPMPLEEIRSKIQDIL